MYEGSSAQVCGCGCSVCWKKGGRIDCVVVNADAAEMLLPYFSAFLLVIDCAVMHEVFV